MTTNSVVERGHARTRQEKSTFRRPENDRFGSLFEAADLVPETQKGHDRYLDVVSWNLRAFHERDPKRVLEVAEVMAEINADLFVLQEVREGSLEPVIRELSARGAGNYEAIYGETGGCQRVAFLYDLDWVRTKDYACELFERALVTTPEGQEAFPRLPLWTSFTLLRAEGIEADPIDFQMVGLHLESQRAESGSAQRGLAAQALSDWMRREACELDSDLILVGDWSQIVSAPEWAPFHALERQGKASFRRISDDGPIARLMYRNAGEFGSRVELETLSLASMGHVRPQAGDSIRWIALDQLAQQGEASRLKARIEALRQGPVELLPVMTRFYFMER